MSADEKFFAWLDGELAEPDATEVEARVSRDPELRRLAQQHQAVQTRLGSAFNTVLEAPVPDRLVAAARRVEPNVVDFAAARTRRQHRWPSVAQWGSMAATLAVGVLIGTMVPKQQTAPIELDGGKVLAAARLHQALETQLASAPTASGVQIPMTFRDQSGAVCRSFVEPSASGVACRSGDRWQVRGLFAAPEGQSGEFRMAAGTDPQLMALIENSIAGAPLDAAGEQAAKARGWR